MGWALNPFTGKFDKTGGGGSSTVMEELHLTSVAGYGSTNTFLPYYTTETVNTLSTLATLTNDSTNGCYITADANFYMFGVWYSQYSNGPNLYCVRDSTDYTSSPTAQAPAKVVTNNAHYGGFFKAYLEFATYVKNGEEIAWSCSSVNKTDDANWLLHVYLLSV